ncbi:hypothetical protein [Streptomyces sp. SKN60]|nr:hypothetical protein [Streptomyces sp. SKN60]
MTVLLRAMCAFAGIGCFLAGGALEIAGLWWAGRTERGGERP